MERNVMNCDNPVVLSVSLRDALEELWNDLSTTEESNSEQSESTETWAPVGPEIIMPQKELAKLERPVIKEQLQTDLLETEETSGFTTVIVSGLEDRHTIAQAIAGSLAGDGYMYFPGGEVEWQDVTPSELTGNIQRLFEHARDAPGDGKACVCLLGGDQVFGNQVSDREALAELKDQLSDPPSSAEVVVVLTVSGDCERRVQRHLGSHIDTWISADAGNPATTGAQRAASEPLSD